MAKDRQVGRVKVGALDLEAFFPDGSDADWWITEELFDTNAVILSQLRKDVRDAGFPQYPARKAEPLEVTAERAAGARPNLADAADIPGSHAFALVEMAREEYRLAQAVNRGDAGAAWRSGVRMGLLAEWWRWRSSDNDRRAAAKQRSEAAYRRRFANASTANAERKAKADAWRVYARNAARDEWVRRPNLTAKAVAEHVRKAMARDRIYRAAGEQPQPPSVDRIRKEIADLKPA